MKLLAKNLYFLRRSNAIQQAEIPVLLGVPQSSWSNWENGKNNPDIDTLILISNYFGVSIDDLVKTDLESTGKVITGAANLKKGKLKGKPIGKGKSLMGMYKVLISGLEKTQPELGKLLAEICENIDLLRGSSQ